MAERASDERLAEIREFTTKYPAAGSVWWINELLARIDQEKAKVAALEAELAKERERADVDRELRAGMDAKIGVAHGSAQKLAEELMQVCEERDAAKAENAALRERLAAADRLADGVPHLLATADILGRRCPACDEARDALAAYDAAKAKEAGG